MVLLVLYLYQTIPQLLPRTTLDFAGKLGDKQVRPWSCCNISSHAVHACPSCHMRVRVDVWKCSCCCTFDSAVPGRMSLNTRAPLSGNTSCSFILLFVSESFLLDSYEILIKF